ncbi:MAG: diadenylate cyclase CdaA [Oscillospiraceae bacterium]|nr:diadenylate cyclase CdaA [Oscillospiraceae bacterium]
MDEFHEILTTLSTLFPPTIFDILDIIALTYVIYKIMHIMDETRLGVLVKGIIMLVVLYGVTYLLQMHVFNYIMRSVFSVGIIAVLIIFQPELRRTIESVGITGISTLMNFTARDERADILERAINVVCDLCMQYHEDAVLNHRSTGALMVFERETKLGEYISGGTMINAIPSTQLLGSIFWEGTPLHDGAVIFRDGMVYAAGCFLPKAANDEDVDKKLGARHRAAIGLGENSDAVIVLVSEETGDVSIAEGGMIETFNNRDDLRFELYTRILPKMQKPLYLSNKPKFGRNKDKPKKKAATKRGGKKGGDAE